MKTKEAQGCDGDPDRDDAAGSWLPSHRRGRWGGQPMTVPWRGVQRGSQRREAEPRLSQTLQLT